MELETAILGMLSEGARTGYDLKRLMQQSPIMPWSGNNNQIYKALSTLLDEGHVDALTVHQDGAPTKKIYSLTADGRAALNRALLSPPEAPVTRHDFLMQLRWADALSIDQIKALLDRYILAVRGAMQQLSAPEDNHKQLLHTLIDDNIISGYQAQLDWADRAKSQLNASEGAQTMQHELIDLNGRQYIKLGSEGEKIQTERDGLDIVGLCMEHGTHAVLIDGARLSDEFMGLWTGVAGAVLQKWSQYGVKVAVTLDMARVKGSFAPFLSESNKGSAFRAFESESEAVAWLMA